MKLLSEGDDGGNGGEGAGTGGGVVRSLYT
jgi:hypothetical protein